MTGPIDATAEWAMTVAPEAAITDDPTAQAHGWDRPWPAADLTAPASSAGEDPVAS